MRKTLIAALTMALSSKIALAQTPERVNFPSADGRTALVGYLFRPDGASGNKKPAIVMMHGRAGAYSTAAKRTYDATTLSQRHRAWGDGWSGQLGDGRTTPSATPVTVAGLPRATAIAAGAFSSMALASDGSAWAWGQNGSGEDLFHE